MREPGPAVGASVIARLLSAVTLSACAGAPHPIAEPTASVSPERCVLTGLADELVVSIDLVPDVLHVVGLPVEVHVGSGDTSPVHVLRPIVFDGRTARASVRASLATPFRSSFEAAAGAEVVDVVETADGAVGTVRLEGNTMLEDGDWVGVRAVLGCEALRLGGVTPLPGDGPAHEGAPSHLLVGPDVPLAEGPEGPAHERLVLSLPEGDPRRAVRVVEEAGDRARVERRYTFGAVVGWVDRAHLVPTTEPWQDVPAFDGLGSRGCGGTPRHAYTYRGMASVRRGTPVHAEPGLQPWGRLADDVVTEVAVREDGTAEIVSLEGLESGRCATLEWDLAIVPASAVTPMPGALRR